MRFGLFDSGIGGFTVLKKVVELCPNTSFVYLADTARLPYGDKNYSEIKNIANEVSEWFREEAISALLVGCNTTNSLAFDSLEKGLNVPVFGLLDAVGSMISEERIGVLATSATVTSNAYKDHIQKIIPGAFVCQQACPGFVPMIEKGNLTSEELREMAIQYIKPLLQERVEAIVLGCSHYPLLRKLLEDLLPPDVRILDPAIGLVDRLDEFLGGFQSSIYSPKSLAKTRFCTTSHPHEFAHKARSLLGVFPEVELVSLRSKTCFF